MFNCQESRLVTRADVAQIFGVCIKTIDNYIDQGLLPQPVQFASREYWHPEDMRSFIDATFRRTAPHEVDAPVPAGEHSTTPATAPPSAQAIKPSRPRLAGTKDSHPTVRAKARQRELLQRLNANNGASGPD